MALGNNLFGTIASQFVEAIGGYSTGANFIPIDGAGNIIDVKNFIGSGEASWIGLNTPKMQEYAYTFCFPVSTVVDRLAEYDTNGVLKIFDTQLDKEGKKVLASSPYAKKLNALFEQPNPLQSWAQFRAQQIVYKKIFGWCAVLPLKPIGMGNEFTVSLINLPPHCVTASKRKVLQATSKSELIENYKISILGKSFTVPANDLLILEDGLFQDPNSDYLFPLSKLVGLDMAVSNICAAMEADNVLLRKRGAIGFISHDAAATKDSTVGYLPMSEKEKNEVQESLSQYGLSLQQYQWAISRQAIKWNPISFNSAELQTKETVTEGAKAICNRYGFPYVLYNESDTTFANGETAHKSVYQNNVMPNAEKDIKMYEKFFNAMANGLDFQLDFSHLPILQMSELTKAATAIKQNEVLQADYMNGLITMNQWRVGRGYQPVTGGDAYYTAPLGITN